MRNPFYLALRCAALLLALFALAAAPLALAATTLSPPLITWGNNQTQLPGPVSIIGQDPISGFPCVVGQAPTCALAGVPFVKDYEVSAANTAQSFTYTLANVHDTLSIVAQCSAGMAALTISASTDNVHFITVDTLVAATTNAKLYTASTMGATTTISPLSFPYLTVTVSACGAGNTSTLSVGAK